MAVLILMVEPARADAGIGLARHPAVAILKSVAKHL